MKPYSILSTFFRKSFSLVSHVPASFEPVSICKRICTCVNNRKTFECWKISADLTFPVFCDRHLCLLLTLFPTGSQSKFSLAQDTGIITLQSAFTQDDYEFVLNITARDDGSCCGSGTSLSNMTYIVIQVMGTNNYKPTFTNCSAYDLSNVVEESPNNSFVIQVDGAIHLYAFVLG